MSKKLIVITHEHKHGVSVYHAYIDDKQKWDDVSLAKAMCIDYDPDHICETLDWNYVNDPMDLTEETPGINNDDSGQPEEATYVAVIRFQGNDQNETVNIGTAHYQDKYIKNGMDEHYFYYVQDENELIKFMDPKEIDEFIVISYYKN